MHSFRFALASFLILFCAGMSSVSFAQDPLKVASNVYSFVIDTEGVRMLKVTFKPGDATVMHQHPFHIAYVISGGELTITNKGGKPQVFKLTPGMAITIPATTHMAKNTGTTTVEALVVEIKNKTGKPPAKKPSK
jgi:quercetin dioxygenase-like cupin family protein